MIPEFFCGGATTEYLGVNSGSGLPTCDHAMNRMGIWGHDRCISWLGAVNITHKVSPSHKR